MASLFEQFNQRLAEPEIQPDQQAQIQSVLAAKGGKAAGGSTAPAQSALGQQAAQEQVQTAKDQQRLQGAATAAQLKSQEQQQKAKIKAESDKLDVLDDMAAQERITKEVLAEQQIAGTEQLASEKLSADRRMTLNNINNQVRQKLATLSADREGTMEDLWSTFQRSEKELAFRRDAAVIEQVGFMMALQDQQYTSELDRIGKRRMLEDEIQFEQELLNTRLGNNMTNFLDGIDFLQAFNADKRTFQEALATIDLDRAIQLLEEDAKSQNSQRAWEGAFGTLQAGADIYGQYKDGDFSNDAETEDEP